MNDRNETNYFGNVKQTNYGLLTRSKQQVFQSNFLENLMRLLNATAIIRRVFTEHPGNLNYVQALFRETHKRIAYNQTNLLIVIACVGGNNSTFM